MHFSWRNPNLCHLSKAHIWTLSSHPPRDAITAAPTGSAQHRTQILPQTFSSSVYLFPRLNLPWPRTIPKPRRPHALNTSCADAPSLSSLSLPIPQTPHLGLLTVLAMSQSALPWAQIWRCHPHGKPSPASHCLLNKARGSLNWDLVLRISSLSFLCTCVLTRIRLRDSTDSGPLGSSVRGILSAYSSNRVANFCSSVYDMPPTPPPPAALQFFLYFCQLFGYNVLWFGFDFLCIFPA